MKSTNKIKVSAGRRAFMAFNYLFFVCIIILCAYPLWYVLVQSLSGEIVSGEGIVWPYKNSILMAYQKAYVRLAWEQVFKLIQVVLQILVLIFTGNFILYLIVQLTSQFMINVAIARKVDREYAYLKDCHEFPAKAERNLSLIHI